MAKRCIYICAFIICVACSGNDPKNNFGDEVLVKIADLQDRRATDSLVSFLTKTGYQRTAALALASVQDTSAIDDLGRIAFGWGQDTSATNNLNDLSTLDLETRINAAFALGQMYSPKAAEVLYAASEIGNADPDLMREVYEALGKVTPGKKDVEKTKNEERNEKPPYTLSLKDVTIAGATDMEGIAWGIYRAGLRGKADSADVLTAAMILAEEFGGGARLPAAHFFSRSQFQASPDISKVLVSAASDPDPEIRMAVVNSLSKVKGNKVLEALVKATEDPDYRVRVSAARAFRTQPWDFAKKYYEKLLADPNVHVSVAAAEAIGPIASASDSTLLREWARKATNWRTQATLYDCLLKLSGSMNIHKELQDLYITSTNPYQQSALLMALSNNWRNVDFIVEQFRGSKVKVITSTAANALVRINKAKKLPADINLAGIYEEIIRGGDQGAILNVCQALTDSTLGYEKTIKDFSFLEEAKAKLSLPKDDETYVPLEQALNYLKGLPPPPPLKNEYNHPIDWTLVASIKKDQKVVIETTKGTIVMTLFVEEAPGSVANFVKLINDKYFDGKYFHRVVPNFVIQTGCDRGDGFGSLDYSIRSEFSRRKYRAGSVGMASAGKDTEGVQWFITHSPTPHLDGKYTIFAEVIDGMDVVHKVEVGDQIISAHLAD